METVEENLVEFIVIEKIGEKLTGHGTHSFRVAPRVGEFISMEDADHMGQTYQVIAVVHATDPGVGTKAGDLYIEHRGTDTETIVDSSWVHTPPLGAEHQPGLAPWVHTIDYIRNRKPI